MEIASHRWLNGRWIIGGALIALGILFLLMNVGVIDKVPIWNIWKYWPVVLIAMGVNKLFTPYNRAEGFWLLSLGVWFQVSLMHLWGFGFHDTWPGILIALGIFWMWGALERESRRKKAAEQLQ